MIYSNRSPKLFLLLSAQGFLLEDGAGNGGMDSGDSFSLALLRAKSLCAIWVTAKNNSSNLPPPEDWCLPISLPPFNLFEAGRGGWAGQDVGKCTWKTRGGQRWRTAVLSFPGPGAEV